VEEQNAGRPAWHCVNNGVRATRTHALHGKREEPGVPGRLLRGGSGGKRVRRATERAADGAHMAARRPFPMREALGRSSFYPTPKCRVALAPSNVEARERARARALLRDRVATNCRATAGSKSGRGARENFCFSRKLQLPAKIPLILTEGISANRSSSLPLPLPPPPPSHGDVAEAFLLLRAFDIFAWNRYAIQLPYLRAVSGAKYLTNESRSLLCREYSPAGSSRRGGR